MGIYTKLGKIQKDLFVPKGQRNDFGKYNYRSCEDVLKAVKPLCEENGCVLYITNNLEAIGDRNYVKAVVTLVDIETNETISSTAHAREEETLKGMTGSQITGASSSYARKYALAGLFGIDNEKDSDATNKGEQPDKDKAVQDAEIKTQLLAYINKCNMSADNIAKIAKHYKKNDIKELTAADCKDYLEKLKGKTNE